MSARRPSRLHHVLSVGAKASAKPVPKEDDADSEALSKEDAKSLVQRLNPFSHMWVLGDQV